MYENKGTLEIKYNKIMIKYNIISKRQMKRCKKEIKKVLKKDVKKSNNIV